MNAPFITFYNNNIMDISFESENNSFSVLNKAVIYSDEESTPPNKKMQSFWKRKQQIEPEKKFSLRQSLNQLDQSLNNQTLLTPQSNKYKFKEFQRTKTAKINRKNALLYEQICPICLNQFTQPKARLQCNHQFCLNCLTQWIKTATVCPCCRLKFTSYLKDKKQTIEVQTKEMDFKEEDYFVCYVCGRGDNEHVLLICDVCDFYCCHIYCDSQLSNNIPEGDWFCKYCSQNFRENQLENQEENNRLGFDDTISSIESTANKNNTVNQRSQNRNTEINTLLGMGGTVYRLRQLRRR